jgi:hypothetical protein
MNSRERVTRAIHFGRPDRPPISHAVLPSAQYHYGRALAEILDEAGEDFGWHLLADLPPEKLPPLYRLGEHADAFGTVWRVSVQGRCGIPIAFPLADWSAYERFVWPRFEAGPPAYRLYSGHIAGVSDDYYARGAWITFFEQMQQLRGFQALLEDLMDARAEVFRLRDDLLRFNLDWLDRWLACDYQGLHFADDWGTQRNLMLPPALWRSFFKPSYAAMFAKVKAAGLDVWLHSDGNIIEILPDLVEIGVDVLNCQTSVMGAERIGRDFAGRLCFRTDLDRQNVMPFASPQEVKEHVFALFDALGTADGGIVACGEISEDVPLANIRAMYEAFREYRH